MLSFDRFASLGCMCKEFLFCGGDPRKGQRTGKLHFGYGKGKYLRGPAGSELSDAQKGLYGAGAVFPQPLETPGPSGQEQMFEDSLGWRPKKYLVPGTKEPYYLEGPESNMGRVDMVRVPPRDRDWLWNTGLGSSGFSKKRKRDHKKGVEAAAPDSLERENASILDSNLAHNI